MTRITPGRNIALEILTAHRKADVDALAVLAQSLATSLAVAEATIAELRRAEDEERREAERIARERRERDAARKRRVRNGPPESDGIQRTDADSPPFSPTPPFPTPASSSSSSAREALVTERLPDDAARNALTVVLSKCGDQTAVLSEIKMVLDGGRPNVSRDPAHVGLALADYAANESRWNSALFRACVQRAARPAEDRPARPRRGEKKPPQTFEYTPTEGDPTWAK